MTKETNYVDTSSNIINLLEDHHPKREPFVRYAHPVHHESGRPSQKPVLHSIYDPIPDDANWASAIYFLKPSQREKLEKYADNPYGNPKAKNIANQLQNECQGAGYVLYPIHAESDAHEDGVPLQTMIGWLEEFIKDILDKNPNDCRFYYSGKRSIHIHSQLFMTESQRDQFKEQAKQFCDETGAELDTTVYKTKQQFRIPGAVHEKIGLQKVNIETDWTHEEIISASAGPVPQPETYAQVLKTIFRSQNATDLNELILSTTSKKAESFPTMAELKEWYESASSIEKRARNEKEFYPYPTGSGNDGHSVAAIEIINKPFQRRDAGKNRTYVPCFFYGAHSCSGRDYMKYKENAPLQLSKADAKEWDYEKGDTLIVIGGGNFSSRILEVDETTVKEVGELLNPEDGDRDKAKEYLQSKDYDVGSTGPSQPNRTTSTANQEEKGPTDAELLQRRAEEGCVEQSLNHTERRNIANRLLTIGGWELTRRWFREQYGDDFDVQETRKQAQRVIDTFPEDFRDVTIPSH